MTNREKFIKDWDFDIDELLAEERSCWVYQARTGAEGKCAEYEKCGDCVEENLEWLKAEAKEKPCKHLHEIKGMDIMLCDDCMHVMYDRGCQACIRYEVKND